MQQSYSQITEPQQVEIGLAAAVRHERNRLSVRRPRGMEIGVLVVGEAPQSRAIAVDDEEIGEAVAEAAEHELLLVRRPLRGLQPVQADVDTALCASALDVEQDQVVGV